MVVDIHTIVGKKRWRVLWREIRNFLASYDDCGPLEHCGSSLWAVLYGVCVAPLAPQSGQV